MKKIFMVFTVALTFMASCKKTDLQLNNPNSPTPAGSLTSQIGIEDYALGMWSKTVVSNNLLVHGLVIHSIMGDEQFSSVGNFGWRYCNQVDKITTPAPYNNVVPNVFNTTQLAQLKSLNTLGSSAASVASNAFVWEWNFGYFINGQANVLLKAIADNPSALSATEKATLQAWAYWWKGVGYSRVGSMYLAGVINNSPDGTTNSTFVAHDAIIAEANANFDKAIALLTPISATDATYKSTLGVIIPSFNVTTTFITPAMWIREMYTYEARNYMVNKKVAAMTTADWTTVRDLALKGLVAGDVTFSLGMDPAGSNDLSGSQQHPYEWDSFTANNGWTYPSERWVQDFKTGDARFTKGVTALNASQVVVNRSSRGIQFGTRYMLTTIENGGYWSTDNHKGQVQFACSWEENNLILAEAYIRTSQIEIGLPYIDQVRSVNGASLAAIANTGLGFPAAIEELRRERRVALFLRGTAFFDARRNGVTAPVSAGGGRAGAIVLVPNSITGATPSTGYQALACVMDYNYADYWDVPITELSYNTPALGSAVVAN
ncbi:hypothetical protein KXQ82_03245 [Mucilaginibacter sp. HMF5004]|uniref:hypothetical protein n=1 Tax=Mucilaginibacter rivuli TaxID=2857527 RepID=UPI001C5EC8A5|nr:hypothetical protein [Mucilaginibacter rivuli]MBW4888709.1 hypothetical protein [Mucilaginibacter rivuli]